MQAVDFYPFAGPELARLIPFTSAQAEVWLACQLGGDDASRAYNESVSLRLRGGPLEQAALREALAALAQRHEVLRATCSANGRVLCVTDSAPAFDYEDLSATTEAAALALALAAHAADQAAHVFDLLAGPLWRTTALRLAPDDHLLTLTAHHLICDGWSLGLLLQDLGQLYSAAARGEEAALPPAVQYSEYADAEALYQQSAEYRAASDFWRAEYADGGPALDLPTDFARPPTRTYGSQRLDLDLPEALVAALRTAGRQAGCSFNTTLLALFEVLLFRVTGQPDVVVGMPAAGQAATGLTSVVGHCVNLLPLRSHPRGELTFLDYLQGRKTALFDALEHQQLTYGSLLRQLPVRREAGRLPLVAVLFNVDLGLDDGVTFAGLHHELRSNPRGFENFELALNASGAGNRLTLECAYNTGLFRPARVARLLASYVHLAEQVVARPATLLADLALAPAPLPAAYARLNATEMPYPAAATLTSLIEAQALATPGKTAVVFGLTALTYAELNTQATHLAAALQARHLRHGQLVGLALERTPALLVALLAVLKCGAAYLPLDPTYPAECLRFMLPDAEASLLLTSAGPPPGFAAGVPVLVLEDVLAEAQAAAQTPAPVPATSQDLCYLLYTSGSTGQPKGVPVTHQSVVNFLTSMQREPGIGADDRLLAVTTISFDIAALELFLPLVSGATVVLADGYTTRDGRALRQLLEAEHITLMQATPATWTLLLAAGWDAPLPLVALCGGEALPPALAQRLLPLCQALWNLYGPTETTIWSALGRVTGGPITVGRPIANTQVYVLDEQGAPVEPGTVGELVIGGAGVAAGYWRRPALTAERFRPDAFAGQPGSRLYRTGDAGRLLPSGEIEVLGRLDEQLKLRGFRIEPGEIEAALTSLPGIAQAVVVAQEHPPGHRRLVAYVVPCPASGAEAPAAGRHRTEWQAALHERLPAHLVPTEFVLLPELPLTRNGKIDRRALQQSGPASLAPTSSASASSAPTSLAPARPAAGTQLPRTSVEELVAAVWREALGMPLVSVYDNFFDLGGHSLIAVQVMARLEQQTGKRLPLAALFTYPTVAALALLLQLDGRSVTWDSLVPIKPDGTKMPLYLVHGYGLNVLLFNALARNLDPQQPLYGLQAKGLNGVDAPLARIEDMAAHYLAAIRVQNPTGPYALAGFSFGGLIAFEMARQLLAEGLEVKFLAMFDTYAYQSDQHLPWLRRAWRATATVLHQLRYTLGLLARAPGRTLANKRAQARRRLRTLLNRLGHRPTGPTEFAYPPQLDVLNEQAGRCYVLRPLPVRVDVFRATEQTFYLPDFEYLGWRPYAGRGVRVHDMPGEHSLMFAPPNDQGFAAELQAALDEAAGA